MYVSILLVHLHESLKCLDVSILYVLHVSTRCCMCLFRMSYMNLRKFHKTLFCLCIFFYALHKSNKCLYVFILNVLNLSTRCCICLFRMSYMNLREFCMCLFCICIFRMSYMYLQEVDTWTCGRKQLNFVCPTWTYMNIKGMWQETVKAT